MPKLKKSAPLPAAPQPRPIGLPPLDPIQPYDLREVGAYLRTSRASVYKLVRAGKLTLSKRGKRSYCKGSVLIGYMRSM